MIRNFIAASLLVAMSSTAFADTPVLDKRQANQEARIEQGVKSGELTKPEARRLTRSEERLERHEEQAKADGVVTKKERAKLHNEADRTSARIHRQKHDRQDR